MSPRWDRDSQKLGQRRLTQGTSLPVGSSRSTMHGQSLSYNSPSITRKKHHEQLDARGTAAA